MNNELFLKFCEFDKNVSEKFVGRHAFYLFHCLLC